MEGGSSLTPEHLAAIDALLERKRKLEQELTTAIYESVERFKKDTGLSVYRIDVELTDIKTFAERRGNYIVSDVETRLEL